MNCKIGDRVADRFKQPRAGDESNRGTITRICTRTKMMSVDMDTGLQKTKTMPFGQFDAMFDVIGDYE